MKKSLLKIDEQGAKFKSYVDGSIHYLTPERSIEIQRQLGADLIVVLDECTPFNVDKEYTAASMRRSHRWVRDFYIYHSELNFVLLILLSPTSPPHLRLYVV
jgi:tRNA-guanine family transglycosylase